jgi:hypothetical protein
MMERFCFVMSVTGLNICLILGEMRSAEDLVALEGCWPCVLKDLGLKNNQIECVTFCLSFSSCDSGKMKICVCEERQVHQLLFLGRSVKS